MLRSNLLLPLLSLASLACSGTVASSLAGGTTSGSGGATSTASAGTTGAGAGTGTMSSSSTAVSSVSASASSGAGGGACGTLSLREDDGAPQIYTTNCASNTSQAGVATAVGWYSASPVQPPEVLNVVGCASAAAGAEGISLQAENASGPGSYDQGGAQYTDAQGATWSSEVGKAVFPVSMVVTSSDTQAIDGTFTATVASMQQVQHQLTGSFHVCHGADFFPP